MTWNCLQGWMADFYNSECLFESQFFQGTTVAAWAAQLDIPFKSRLILIVIRWKSSTCTKVEIPQQHLTCWPLRDPPRQTICTSTWLRSCKFGGVPTSSILRWLHSRHSSRYIVYINPTSQPVVKLCSSIFCSVLDGWDASVARPLERISPRFGPRVGTLEWVWLGFVMFCLSPSHWGLQMDYNSQFL